MRKKILVTIFFSVVAIIIISVLLYRTEKRQYRSSGFERSIVDMGFKSYKEIPLPNQGLKIAGIYENSLYLMSSNPLLLYKLDTLTNELRLEKLVLPAGEDTSLIKYAFNIEVQHPIVELYACNLGKIFHYDLNTKRTTFSNTVRNFSRGIKIGLNKFVVREFDSLILNQELVLYDYNFKIRSAQKEMNENVNDAGIASSGFFKYDPVHARLYFIHYFGHNVKVLDTGLNLLQTINTIDTFTGYHANIKAAKVSEKKTSYSYSKPRSVVNLNATFYNDHLFVMSALKAGNQSDESFRDSVSIDIYNSIDGNYYGSFLVPKFKNVSPTDFRVFRDRILLIYPAKMSFMSHLSADTVFQE